MPRRVMIVYLPAATGALCKTLSQAADLLQVAEIHQGVGFVKAQGDHLWTS